MKNKIFTAITLVTIVVMVILGMTLDSGTENMTEVEAQQLSDNYYTYDKSHYTANKPEASATLLSFYAGWCASCNAFEPVIKDVMSEVAVSKNIYGYRVSYGDKNDTSESLEMAKSFGVTTQTTTIILTKEGKVFKTFFTAVDREELKMTLLAAAIA